MIYIHVPFCTKKCPYCHFYVVPDGDHELLRKALLREWEQKCLLIEEPITSVYFGGGTPSLFEVGPILEKLPLAPDCEITCEANPERTDALARLRASGVNRLSLGVQSLDDTSLSALGRTHSAQAALRAIHTAHAVGFTNISIDLMYDIPDQTEESFQRTLDQIPNLPIQHLSLYNLTIEPHTPFAKRRLNLPTPDLSLRLLQRACASIPFPRYEISAFARPGFASRHNLGYWTYRPFLGLGPSAFSYWKGTRSRNIAHLKRYAQLLEEGLSPTDFSETLPPDKALRERLAIQLRLLEGAPHPRDATLQPTLEKLSDEGLITLGERICLTERGLLFYDTVASAII